MTRDQFATSPLTHAALNRALTSGFRSAFEVAGLFASGGFVAALVAVRHHAAPTPASVEVEIAA